MKQDYKNSTIKESDDIKSVDFSIQTDPSMFLILTSKIYKNPKKAVIREWSTNAVDACIDAGKPIKFDVHIPTNENLEFSVRDYGNGLSQEQVEGLFTTVGASTKRDDQNQNGCLGIGRLAGLAVADSFTVESYYEGKLYNYLVTIENGIPCIKHLGTIETSEPNGLKLSILVDHDDVSNYKDLAVNVYKYFEHKPNINLSKNLSLNNNEIIKGPNWYIEKSFNRYATKDYIIMSNVAYEIPYNSEIESYRINGDIFFYCEPNEISFNPGRESLSLDKKTINFINNLYSKFDSELKTTIFKEISKKTTDLKKLKEICRFTDIVGKGNVLNFELAKHLSYLSPFINYNLYINYESISKSELVESYYSTSHYYKKEPTSSIQSFIKSHHIIVDTKINYHQQIHEEYSSLGKEYVVWHRSKDQDLDEFVTGMKNLLTKWGITYRFSSEFVETNRISNRQKTRNNSFQVKILDSSFSFQNYRSFEYMPHNISPYVYIPLNRTTPSTLYDFNFYKEIFLFLARINHNDMHGKGIFGITKTNIPHVKNNPLWIDLKEFIDSEISKIEFYLECEIINNIDIKLSDLKLIKQSTLKFPENLKIFINTLIQYKEKEFNPYFIQKSTYIYEKLDHLDTKFISYENDKKLLNEVLNNYPITLNLLSKQVPIDHIVKIADWEEKDALCTNN